MGWLDLLVFGTGVLAGFSADVARTWWTRASDAVQETVARPGIGVFLHGDQVVSRRRIKGVQDAQLRHHGRKAPDTYAYIGRNDAGEHMFRLVIR